MIIKMRSRPDQEIIVDDNFYELHPECKGKSIYLHGGRYPSVRLDNKSVLLHHVVMGKPPEGKVTDHINRIKTDNRTENLRFVTPRENALNKDILKKGKSGVPGVFWYKQTKKWRVQLRKNGKLKYFGSFTDMEDAICTRIVMGRRYHGEFDIKM